MFFKRSLLVVLVVIFSIYLLHAKLPQGNPSESGMIGFGFSKNTIHESEVFYLEMDNNSLKIEKEKFKIGERKGTNKEKIIFDIYNPSGSINKYLKKKGLSFINIKIGTLLLERIENSTDKFRGFVNFKVLPSNIKLPSKLYVIFKKKEND